MRTQRSGPGCRGSRRRPSTPAPAFDPIAVTAAPPFSEARVAIVTTAGLRPAGGIDLWRPGDFSFTVLPGDARDLQLSHFSPNFDRVGIAADLNVVLPADRLVELAADGTIGSVATNHLSFMGAQTDETDAPLACALPPRFDPALPAALDEVTGLRPAYDRQLQRSGRTLVGRTAERPAPPAER